MSVEENLHAVDPVCAETKILSSAEKWSLLQQYAQEQGLALFDVEFPAASSGILRVFVCGAGEKPGPIMLEQCSQISRRILDSQYVEQLMPGSVTLEVSSPGVNRKLTRPEHYAGAIGERVKLKLKANSLELAPVVLGKVVQFSAAGLKIILEERKEKGKPGAPKQQSAAAHREVEIPLELIRDGRINFNFNA